MLSGHTRVDASGASGVRPSVWSRRSAVALELTLLGSDPPYGQDAQLVRQISPATFERSCAGGALPSLLELHLAEVGTFGVRPAVHGPAVHDPWCTHTAETGPSASATAAQLREAFRETGGIRADRVHEERTPNRRNRSRAIPGRREVRRARLSRQRADHRDRCGLSGRRTSKGQARAVPVHHRDHHRRL